MINSLGEWLTEWANDSKVSVVIIRGQGKAFCAGIIQIKKLNNIKKIKENKEK